MTRQIDDILEDKDIEPWIEIAKGIWVKDFVEFRAFWARVHKQIW